MATAGTIKIPMSTAAKSLETTIHVRVGGLRRFRFRMWLAGLLVRAAAVVLPVPTKVVIENLHIGAIASGLDDTCEREQHAADDR